MCDGLREKALRRADPAAENFSRARDFAVDPLQI
jgi:hypothetical protein